MWIITPSLRGFCVFLSSVVVLTLLAGGCGGKTASNPYTDATVPPPDVFIPEENFHYVREGATGLNDGSDWANAWTELPETLLRGHAYYVADGSYPGYDFDAAEAEEGGEVARIYISIRKATVADHGTDTGWQDDFGDGVAVFDSISFSSWYWELDGRVGSGKTGHGLKIQPSVCGDQTKAVRLNDGPGHISIRHVEMELCGDFDAGHDIIYGAAGVSNLTVSHCYLHDVSRCPFLMRGWQNVVIEHCAIENAGNSYGIHMEGISDVGSDSVTVRYNVWENIAGTGIIIMGNVSNYQIYGNLFVVTDPGYTIGGNGAIGTWTGDGASYVRVYNNSFVGLVGLNVGLYFDGGSGNEAYNNIWYDCSANVVGFANVDHDHNWFFDNWRRDRDPPINLDDDLSAAEPNGQLGAGDPFLDRTGMDFRLAAPTDPGRVLPAPYDLDMNGIPRGGDGVWDRGAFEYQ